MQNQNNETNQENTSFNDQAQGEFNKIQNASGAGGTVNQQKLSKGVTSDDDENAGETYSKNLMNRAEQQVRETEDASLQDDTYSFDEDNTDNEEYHDAGGGDYDSDELQ